MVATLVVANPHLQASVVEVANLRLPASEAVAVAVVVVSSLPLQAAALVRVALEAPVVEVRAEAVKLAQAVVEVQVRVDGSRLRAIHRKPLRSNRLAPNTRQFFVIRTV